MQRRHEGGGYQSLTVLNANQTSYTDNTVQTGTAYYYRVRAVDEANQVQSAFSNEVTATIPDSDAEPTNTPVLTHVSSEGLEVTLFFTNPMAPQGPEGGFELILDGARTYDSIVSRLYASEKNLSLTFTLSEPGNHCFQVYARWDTGFEASNEVCAEIDASPSLATPGGLTATASSFDQISITWQDVEEETHYIIERKDENEFIEIASIGADTTAFLDHGLTPNTTYYYRIKAINSNDNTSSGYSNEASASTLAISSRQTDSLALVALYNSANGANWGRNWDLTQPMTTWQGVELREGRVVGVDLYYDYLYGTLPKEIGDLDKLEYLDLRWSGLGGTFPAEIGKLKNLKHFYLSNCGITGKIPDEIGNLANLETLYLDECHRLEGTLPRSLGKLSKLKRLEITESPGIKGKIPEELVNLQNLEYVSFFYSNLSELPDFSNHSALQTLIVRAGQFTFKDLLPNISKFKESYDYAPQFDIANPEDGIRLVIGTDGTITLGGIPHVEGNHYEWFKDDIAYANTTTNKLDFQNVNEAIAGAYTCKVTNSRLPDLTLRTEPIIVIVDDEPGVPASPYGLSVLPITASTIELNWTDINSETGYTIERKNVDGSFNKVGNVGADEITFIDNTLSANTTYIYRLQAYNQAGNSPYSDEISVTTPAASDLASPQNIYVETISTYAFEVHWVDNTSGETGFVVERSTNENGPFSAIYTTEANVTSYTDENISSATSYYYRVRAINSNSGEKSDYSAIVATYEVADFVAQYNGNIAAMRWNTFSYDDLIKEKAYTFTYDEASRLTAARFVAKSTPISGWDSDAGHFNVQNIQYDANGNLEKLYRIQEGKAMDRLSYDYRDEQGNYTNQLQAVQDGSGNAAGFKDGANASHEYGYDENGNLIRDDNKGITNIRYNYLNLPEEITFSNGNKIIYIYDATGNKLSKQVMTKAGSSTFTNTTDYVAGIQYSQYSGGDKKLDFIAHAEGRVKAKDGAYTYQYDLKDHLGNVRLTFSEDKITDTYKASMEVELAPQEAEVFTDKVSQTRHLSAAANATEPDIEHPSPQYAARLNAVPGYAQTIGPTLSLAVRKGDIVRANVQAYYEAASDNNTLPAQSLVPVIVSAFAGTGIVDGQVIQSAMDAASGSLAIGSALKTDNNNLPHAYLNYILFDENFVYVEGGYQRVTAAANQAHETLSREITATQDGYIFIYVSNESQWDVNVFFDELTVAHEHLDVVQHDDFYPFGLSFNQDKERSLKNKYLYNGKELQNELGLDWYDYGARMYDPALGRFHTVDALADHPRQLSWNPYHYVKNNPINMVDPDGNCGDCFLDLAFIAYDLGEIIYDYATTGKVDAVSTAALGADVGALFVPGVTGAGVATRISAEGAEQAVKHGDDLARAVEQLAKNKEVGKQGEAIVKEQLQKELKPGETLLEQPSFKLESGKRSRPDFGVVDESGNISKTVDAKTGNAKLTKNQQELKEKGGTLTGKKYEQFKGAEAKPNTLEERRIKDKRY